MARKNNNINFYIRGKLLKQETEQDIKQALKDIESKLPKIGIRGKLVFNLSDIKNTIKELEKKLPSLNVNIEFDGKIIGKATTELDRVSRANKNITDSAKNANKEFENMNGKAQELVNILSRIGTKERLVRDIQRYTPEGKLVDRRVVSRDESGAIVKEVLLIGPQEEIRLIKYTKNTEKLRKEAERIKKLGQELQVPNVDKVTLEGLNTFEERLAKADELLKLVYGQDMKLVKIAPPLFTKNGEAIYKLTGQLRTGKDEFKEYTFYIDEATKALYLHDMQIRKTSNRNLALTEQFRIAAEKVLLWAGATSMFYGTLRSFQQGVRDIIELDSAMTDLRKVTNETIDTYEKFREEAYRTGIQLSRTATEVVQATTEFARIGYNLQQAKVLAQQAMLFSNVGDIDVQEASQMLISTIKGFNIEVDKQAKNVQKVVDIFNEIGNNYAITTAGVGEALRRSAASLYAAGNTIEEAVAMVVAANNVIQDPSVVGTALKTVSMRLRGMTEDGESLGEDAIPTLEKAFNKLGLTLKKDENTFKSTYEIMSDLASVWNKLSDTQRADILEQVAG